MFGLGVGELFVILLIAGAQLALAGFVYRDAARRGRDVLPWVALVLVAPLVGFFLYMMSREPVLSTPDADRPPAGSAIGSILARIRSAGVR